MGTRALTLVIDERTNTEVCRIYRQNDGYPSRHGCDIAGWLTGKEPTNGIDGDRVNGAGDLAARLIAHLKGGNDHPGNIYIQPPGGPTDYASFVYGITFPNLPVRGASAKIMISVDDFDGDAEEFAEWCEK